MAIAPVGRPAAAATIRAFSEARDALSIGKVVGSPQHVLD